LGPGGELLVLENRTIAIGTLCTAQRAKLARTRRGTAVKVVFRGADCPSINGKVRLTALITDCSTISGRVKAPGKPAVQFTGATSVCGDGVVDAGSNEQCDGSSTGCDAKQACNACS